MKKIIVSWMLLGSLTFAQAEGKDYLNELPEDKAERMAWFNDARFGMFIHWGLYAVPAGIVKGKKYSGCVEWIKSKARISHEDYEKYALEFNPTEFNADEWVAIAKNAGMKYIVITTKHHDGFCMWDTKIGDWSIGTRTPFERDPMKELAVACKKAGITLCFYHSILDWHHPKANSRDWDEYREKTLKPQLKELLTNYGKIGIIWFDGEWIGQWTEPQGRDLYNFLRNIQPDLIINNRVGKGRKGFQGMSKSEEYCGDYGTPEQEIPHTGFAPEVSWESCMTMNNTWGYSSHDEKWKSSSDLIHKLVDIASKGGNYLLNVGPTAEGVIPPASVERLGDMGKWMKINGESIYGTTATPFKRSKLKCTKKNNRLYVHIFDWPKAGKVIIPKLKNEVTKAYMLVNPEVALSTTIKGRHMTISLPNSAPDSVDSVVVLETVGMPESASDGMLLIQDDTGVLLLEGEDAKIHGRKLRFSDKEHCLAYWTDDTDSPEWKVRITKPGPFEVAIVLAAPPESEGGTFAISVGDETLNGSVVSTGNWNKFNTVDIGDIEIVKAGDYSIKISGEKRGEGLMNLRQMIFTPVEK